MEESTDPIMKTGLEDPIKPNVLTGMIEAEADMEESNVPTDLESLIEPNVLIDPEGAKELNVLIDPEGAKELNVLIDLEEVGAVDS
jgi:hypothetical protein